MESLTCSISLTSLLVFEGCAVAGDPVDVIDVGDAPDLAYYLLDVLHARGLESEPAEGGSVFYGVDPCRDDVDAGVRDRGRYVLQQVHPVEGLHEQLDGEELVGPGVPFDLHKALGIPGLQRPRVHAARRMNDDPAPQGDVSDDLVATHRGATTRQPRQDPARPDDAYAGLLVGSPIGEREGGERGTLLFLLFFLGTHLLENTARHVLGREHTCANGGEHVVRRRVIGRAGHVLQDSRGDLPDPSLLENREYLLSSQAQVVLPVGLVEELPYLVACAPALDHGQPVATRPRVLARDDLHPVARDQLGVQGHDTVVDLGPDRAVADLGVDVVGEVYGRRPTGQADHVALGCEHEDFISDELTLQRLHEIAGVGRLLLPLHHALEPGEAVHLTVGEAVLVHPVCSDPVLRCRVHLGGPDLDLQQLPLVGHDRRMK